MTDSSPVNTDFTSKDRSQCRHERLRFGSGDYYLFCQDCPARWVCSGSMRDEGAPELANQGVGCSLSGELRCAHET